MSNIATNTYRLNITPGSVPTVVYLNQNENGRSLKFQLVSDTSFTLPSGSTATFEGTKPDGNIFSASGTVDTTNKCVTIQEVVQMTAVSGEYDAKLKITHSGNTLATGLIKIVISKDSTNGGTESDSVLNGLVAQVQNYADTFGNPWVASTVSGMTNHDKIYVYVGSETGYVNGNWYYWNGSAWTSGGVYNSTALNTDKTLSIENMAADAKVAGDSLSGANATPIDNRPLIKGNLANNGTWNEVNNSFKHCVVSVNGGETLVVKFSAETQLGFVRSYSTPVSGAVIDYSTETGYTTKKVCSGNNYHQFTIPSDVKYILVERYYAGNAITTMMFNIDGYDLVKSVPKNLIGINYALRYIKSISDSGITSLATLAESGYYSCSSSYISNLTDKPTDLETGFSLIVLPKSAGNVVYQVMISSDGDIWFRWGSNSFKKLINGTYNYIQNGEVSGTSFASNNRCGLYYFTASDIENMTDAPSELENGGILRVEKPAATGQTFQTIVATTGDMWFRYGTNQFKRISNASSPRNVMWYALGDSITQGYTGKNGEIDTVTSNNYVKNVAFLNGYEFRNYGIGGSGYLKVSTVEDPTYPGQNKHFNAKQKVDDIIASENDFTKCDLVTLAYGVNDWHYSQEIGSVSDDKTLGTTMCSNMKYVIEAILDNNPMCKIIVLTPLNCSKYGGDFSTNWGLGHSLTTSGTLQHVTDSIISVCEYYGIEYINQSKIGMVNRKNINDCLGDGIHPLADLYPVLAKDLASKINIK